jgi:hypothetical protein
MCRFGELGRFQFERLCRELLAVEVGVTARGGEGMLVLPDGVTLPGFDRPLAGPTVVAAAWVSGDEGMRSVIDHALAEWGRVRPRSLLVITNVEAVEEIVAGVDVRFVGATALTRLVLSSARLRLRLPSLLGICPESAVVDDEVRSRSSADVHAAFELAEVFVPTRAYAATVDVLERFGFAVLTGPPEMGKTAIARMVGLAKLSDGWEFHECIRPDQLWERFARDRPQVFVADDAFGSTEYRPDAAERWAVELDRVLQAMDARHWLIWTSRPAPLKAGLRRIHREHGVERFPQPTEVQIDAADLKVEETALILFRHAKAARLPQAAVEAVRSYGWCIVSHDHFTPERIRRFVAGRLLQPDVLERLDAGQLENLIGVEIREPTGAMAESLHALAPEYRSLLTALLDVPPGPVPERELAAAVRRHEPLAFAQHPGTLLERLTDHFVRALDAGAVTWVHPSWRDLVIDQLVLDAPARLAFLQRCSVDGILLALSTGGGSAGSRALPLLVEDCDWDAAADRLAVLTPALDEPSTTRLLIALTEAAAHERDLRAGELDALAAYVLDLLRRRWDDRNEPIPIGLLGRWLDLRSLVSERPPLPSLAATWIEALPSRAAFDPLSAAELSDLGDWLTLAELLYEHAPDQLGAFGFPDRYRGLGEVLVGRLGGSADRTDDNRTVVKALRQLADLIPAVADRALETAAIVAVAHEYSSVGEMYVPREISPELQELLDAPTVEHSDERFVMQVLHDL